MSKEKNHNIISTPYSQTKLNIWIYLENQKHHNFYNCKLKFLIIYQIFIDLVVIKCIYLGVYHDI